MNKFRISLSSIKVDNKEQGKKQFGAISNNIQEVTTNLEQFQSIIQSGYSFSPGIFNGKRSNENWISQQVIALDFDNGVAIEDTVRFYSNRGLRPNFLYSTFSSRPEKPKFRLGWILENPLTTIEEYNYIKTILLKTNKNIDKAALDPARIFFPGTRFTILKTHSTVNNEFTVGIENLKYELLSKATISRLGENETKITGSIYINIGTVKNVSVLDSDFNLDIKDVATKVKVFAEFLSGSILSYSVCLGLATNLKYVRGGEKLYKEVINKFYGESDSQGNRNNKLAIFKNIKKYDYLPMNLSNFSPYPEDHLYNNLIDAARSSSPIKLKTKTQVSLAEAEVKLNDYLTTVFESKDTDIHIINVPTGLGKTQALTQRIESDTLYCFNTHKLKNEVDLRTKQNVLVSPEFPEFSIPELNTKIRHLRSIGLSELVKDVIKSFSLNEDDKLKLNLYYETMKECFGSSDPIFTTHHLYSANRETFKHNTIIFDEDPLHIIIQQGKLDLRDLRNIAYQELHKKNSEFLDYLYNELDINPLTSFKKLNIKSVDKHYLHKIQSMYSSITTANIVDVVDAEFITRGEYRDKAGEKLSTDEIFFVKHTPLLENKKYIILDATANIDFYKKLYGDRVKVYDIGKVEQMGDIIQFTDYSYSRSSLSNVTDMDSRLLNPEWETITMLNYKNKFKNPSIHHFGNLRGYDDLCGKNINIVATPHKNISEYILYACILGVEFKSIDLNFKQIEVEYNDWKFKFTTSKNIGFQKIQLSLIESELIQAVGRARTLRNKNTVHLYTTFPLDITTRYDSIKNQKSKLL